MAETVRIPPPSPDPSLPLPEGGPPRGQLAAPAGRRRDLGHETLSRRLEGHGGASDGLVRAAALVGAGLLVGAAARRRTPAMAVLAAAALPLALRGVKGQWPLPQEWRASSVVMQTRLVVWRPPHEVYEAWRSFDRLPGILRHLRCVEALDDGRSRWVVDGPAGKRVEWIAEISEDTHGRSLAWRSVDGSPLQQLGSIVFDDWRDGGTLLRVDIRLLPPAGTAGTAVASILRPALERGLHEDLRRFKAFLEAGEVPTTEGQPSGDRARLSPSNPF